MLWKEDNVISQKPLKAGLIISYCSLGFSDDNILTAIKKKKS